MSATKRKTLMLVFVLIGVSWMFVGCSKGDPELEVSSSTLEFGTAQTQKQISVKNTGNDDGILKSGVKPLNYELDPNVSWVSVSPSSGRCEKDETDKITVSINRTRMTSGTNSGRIDISSNGGDRTVQVTAVKLTPPVCSVSSTTLSFWDVQIGQSKDLTFTITNTGGGTLSGSVSESCSHYGIVSGSGSYSLGAGRSRTVKVRFSPTSIGTKNCTIQTGSSCSNVDCTGVGEEIPPCCSVSPASLNFGNVQVGQSKDLTFTITNCGSTGLTGTISENCVQYSIVSGGGSYSLSPGRSRTVTIRFSPTSTGTKPCTIQTGNNACSDVNCTGVGIEPPCSVSPTNLNFGDVLVGQIMDMIFTIGNPSGAATNLTGSVSESCSHYSIVSGGGSYTLGPGQSLTVTVRFAPTSGGTKTCTIETGSSCSNVSCTGKGIQCTITVTNPTSIDYWKVGDSRQILWNSSEGGLQVKIELYKGDSKQCVIKPYTDNDGYYLWVVDICEGYTDNDYRIKVADLSDGSCWDYSDYFCIKTEPGYANVDPVADAGVYTAEPNTNSGTGDMMGIGRDLGGYQNVSYLRFDLSDIPYHVRIDSAVLEVYVLTAKGSFSAKLNLVAEAWSEMTITWNNKPTVFTSPTQTVYFNASDEYHWRKIHVTNLVNAWINGDRNNYGIAFWCNPFPSTGNYVDITTRETSRDPRLKVWYTPQCP